MTPLHRHFVVWFIAIFIFAFFEWRHPGFVSYIFPFPVVIFIPAGILVAEYLSQRKRI